jgi:Flp pilus assembly protein TadG
VAGTRIIPRSPPPETNQLHARHARTEHQRGQGLAEFALLVPVLLLLVGAGIDFSRLYSVSIDLEAATRDAAEYAATNSTTQADALTQAQRLVCAQFGKGATCTDPAVTATMWPWATDSASGGSSDNPVITVGVTSQTTFRTIVPYPGLTSNGVVTLTASRKYSIIHGR